MAEARLERRIGLPGAIMLSFNGVMGSAIFALPAVLATDFGTFSPWLFPLVGLGTLFILVPFALSTARFPDSGGPALYGAVFGRLAGFELGWVYYIARMVAFAANANVLTAYLARWWAPANEGLARAAILAAVCALLAIVNISGVRRAIALLGGLTLLKALPLMIVALAALATSLPLPDPGPAPSLDQFEAGMLIVFYAFIGFENVVVPAGETKRPERSLPLAMLATLGITITLYFLVQLAFIAALPHGSADEKAPLIDLGRAVAGPAGALALTAAAVCSLAGNLHSAMTSSTRLTYGLAERGDLPRWFGSVHRRFHTPHNSILFFGVAAAALAIAGSYIWLAVISTLARLFVYGVTIAALPKAPSVRKLPLWLYAVGAVGIGLCLWAASQATADAWAMLGILGLAGVILFFLARPGNEAQQEARE